jgi:hypothetical protein
VCGNGSVLPRLILQRATILVREGGDQGGRSLEIDTRYGVYGGSMGVYKDTHAYTQ